MTRAAITHHFGSKDELLAEIVALNGVIDVLPESPQEAMTGLEQLAQLGSRGRAPLANPELATVSRLGTVLIVESYDPDHAARDADVARNRLYRKGIAAIIRRGQRDGSIRKEVDARRVRTEVMSFMLGASVNWSLDPDDVDIVQIYDS